MAQKPTPPILAPPPPPPTPTKPPSNLIITRTEFPKWWKNLASSKINIPSEGAETIVPFGGGRNKYLVSLFFVCSGETIIYLRLGGTPVTGPMSFGGIDEPRGMVLNLGEAPIPCGNEIMQIVSDPPEPPVQVSGIAVYYIEPPEAKTT